MLAQVNNRIWQRRHPITSMRSSFIYYDADYQPISTGNEQARPIRNYYHDVGAFAGVISETQNETRNEIIENIVWLISSAKDESLLVLHQHIQGK